LGDEKEWVMGDEKRKPLNEDMDAQRWAREFNDVLVSKGEQPWDEGWPISWFANAIMCGYDNARREAQRKGR
jgi:hypothetical protein